MRDRRDEIAGFGPGLALAVGLGGLSGLATVAVLVGWLQVADISGTLRPEASGFLLAAGWWVVFWLALSAGMRASLWLGYRRWGATYPVKQSPDTKEQAQG